MPRPYRLAGRSRPHRGESIGVNELLYGGTIGGAQLEPVSYLITGLHLRFGQTYHDAKLAARTEFRSFGSCQGESVDCMISRYEVVRERAAADGEYTERPEICAMTLLGKDGINATPEQYDRYLEPFGGECTITEEGLRALQLTMRRRAQIHDRSPNKVIATALNGGRQARPGAYHAEIYHVVDLNEENAGSAAPAHGPSIRGCVLHGQSSFQGALLVKLRIPMPIHPPMTARSPLT